MIFTILFAIANIVFARAVIYRLGLVFEGQKAHFHEDFREHGNLGFRIKSVIDNVLLQKKLFQEPMRGVMHAFIFYGFVTYLLHTTNQMVAGVFGYWLSDPYAFSLLGFSEGLSHAYEGLVQSVSFLVLIGLAYFAIRRWVIKAKGLDVHSPASAVVIGMIATLMISTLLGEGARVISDTYSIKSGSIRDGFPIAVGVSYLWSAIGVEGASGDIAFKIMWWAHILTVFAFMLYVPTSKHSHLIFAPINFFLATDTPKGALSKLNLEDENALWGSTKVQDFPFPNLLDGMACIECGRCQVQCPANRTGKALNPKAIIVDLKHALLEKMPEVQKARKEGKSAEEIMGMETNVIGPYITEEAIWGCTTCYACVQACPVGNNQVNAIVEMRRNLVLAESNFPAELQGAFQNMENNSNPWGMGAHTRADWAEGLGVKTMAEDSNVDVLYWVGCAGAFDDRSKKTAQSFVKILQKAGVNFGILGTEENCSGDSARRGGNEYLYQTLAQMNVDTMNGYNVQKVVTACPHCYNTIKNEYPQFGGNFEVKHHSDFIKELIQEGKIDIKTNEADIQQTFTYHDPCYLGRYNNGYENPRDLVKVTGGNFEEPSDHHSKSLCCGAGGAQMWMEEQNNDRVNFKRTDQLLETGASTIAVSCPFCMTMITDGVKNAERTDTVKVKDIAEIIADRI
ncbi:MAG: (Fe-S)-binding protein [Leptospiraceae bacterium]|nr:(Fe-S)-binding protein [Leptospiraceae bacterium]MCP5511684.1 (Fe-S)-binding protein [Leptospiraceae bacterium]